MPPSVPLHAAEPARSPLARWWAGWRRRQALQRARRRGYVRFRLTREGIHFVGILVFIFFGAVVRDINLLILLAGAMIGVLLLQWRFNVSTLVGLTVSRRGPAYTAVGQPADIEIRVDNPKHWLGAWLVLIEDPIERVEPQRSKTVLSGRCLIDRVPPRGWAEGRYRLLFHQRGLYRVRSTTISTRYPLGLGRGWREADQQLELIVHPPQGELSPRIDWLLDQERVGQSRAATSVGVHEGEFYGLRPWATGDSKRWIHWRTTARLGHLSVRQFEHRQQRQINVLLDVYDSDGVSRGDSVEKAISFVATLARQMVRASRDSLSVAVAAHQAQAFTSVHSPVLLVHLLDNLAVVKPSNAPPIEEALRALSVSLMQHSNLLIISTRPDQMEHVFQRLEGTPLHRLLARARIRWIDVTAGQLDDYFQLPFPEKEEGSMQTHGEREHYGSGSRQAIAP
ncbi:MAG: DUF58 domain-containing protein [Planctomycetota bacterium]|nr:MAG: DUF58 domain-containing protein [Planctomycetota bacterium]